MNTSRIRVIRGLKFLLITTHEPPSRVEDLGFTDQFRVGFFKVRGIRPRDCKLAG